LIILSALSMLFCPSSDAVQILAHGIFQNSVMSRFGRL
jgi:hypothetical protein